MSTRIEQYLIRWLAVLAALAPIALPAYMVVGPEGLAKMTTNADLICKARVVSSTVITNAAFQSLSGFETRAANLEIISVLKGDNQAKSILFQHYASHPNDRMGMMYSPQHYELENGQSYLIFALKTDTEGVFRQIRLSHTGKEDEGIMRTLDDRFLANIPTADAQRTQEERLHPSLLVKDAHWFELNLLLNSATLTNQLYAIHQLNSMSKGGSRNWGQTDDFKRDVVLKTLLPFVTRANDEMAIAAINCFQAGPNGAALIEPFANALSEIASKSPTLPRRIAAITAFYGTQFSVVSNALPQWLRDPSDGVRLQAVLLLPNFPGAFSEQALRERAADPSPKVRAGVADAIGNGKIASLLPILKTLLQDPVGMTNPVPPLTLAQLQEGGRVMGSNNNDVHTAAGYALMQFDVGQVADILKANLTDEGFRPQYLCKLAEKDTGPWLTNLVEVLELRRIRVQMEVDDSGLEPKESFVQARMGLSGTPYKCWTLIYNHLHDLPAADFANGKMNRCLKVLESARDSGVREPTMLYELYRMKGLHKRAAKFRADNEKRFAGYHFDQFCDKVDAKYPNQGSVSDR